MSERVLTLDGIGKSYPGIIAIEDLSIEFRAGEVHALMGENGAGKSTLTKIIAGATDPDAGTLTFADGIERGKLTPALSKSLGVEVIYQELTLIESLSVAENVCFGMKFGPLVNHRDMCDKAREVFRDMGVDIDVQRAVGSIAMSQKQLVEVARALWRNAKILIMDEPTASLSVSDAGKMFRIVKRLKERGVSIIYISHRINEIFEIADRITVLRDGRKVSTNSVSAMTRNSLIAEMVGRQLTETYPARGAPTGETRLAASGICAEGVRDASFELHRGEILGIGGLVGAGRTELARALCGVSPITSGILTLDGKPIIVKDPFSAMRLGIALIPEDRKKQGCLLFSSVETNISLSCLKKISRLGVINRRKERGIVDRFARRLRVKTPRYTQLVGHLSGGNQQKVVIARNLAMDSSILVFDEPTRGIDVGAKQEIYSIMNELASTGHSIIMISSDMEELLGMSDRILVMCGGTIAGELSKDQFSQVAVLELASGGKDIRGRP